MSENHLYYILLLLLKDNKKQVYISWYKDNKSFGIYKIAYIMYGRRYSLKPPPPLRSWKTLFKLLFYSNNYKI